MAGPLIARNNPVATAAPFYAENIRRPLNWTHRIGARGGFLEAGFDMQGDILYLENWFENGLSRQVTRYDEVGQAIWDGYVFGMTLTLPGIAYSHSLKDLSNRSFCLYSVTDFSGDFPIAGEAALTAAVEEQASMDLYGISEGIVSIGGATESGATAERDTHHDKYRWPVRRPVDAPADALTLHVDLRGFGEWYRHRTYTQTISTGYTDASVVIAGVNTTAGQFIDRTDIETNAYDVPRFYDQVQRKWAWDVLNEIADKGDGGTDDWNWGVYEDRVLRYSETIQEITYFRRLHDRSRRIYSASGAVVQPWQLRPDKFIRTLDAFPMAADRYDDLNRDPTVQYIQAVDWDESDPYSYRIEYREGDSIPATVAEAVMTGGSRF